ncbi:uncharacterized protein BYT42DRAFT_568944 [Radiomyces spectabilis]|uniref:uncharacterized protein n=1 Tax=Radiomyces spectabilis TaxID=64574 RepID=UPI00221F0CE4|nr:uncharacterized protein BYT42DRAFT_568944 [Radiomyces spectabilis]KAI8379477.1 hypothetical protein BYT42DRAFT_568944 [Radiomyces spectabilis]
METLEHQTAPESTRGLFDPPDSQPSRHSTGSHNRRSFQALLDSNHVSRHSIQPVPSQPRQKQFRSRSASTSDMSSPQGIPRQFGLQTLAEEGSGLEATEPRQREEPAISMAVDSLQGMIDSLRSLPPITPGEKGRRLGHRKQQSLSSLSFVPPPSNKRLSFGTDMQSMVQSTVEELRHIPDRTERRRSRRASSISGHQDSGSGRDAALAEAEAKLLGTFGNPVGSNDQGNGMVAPGNRRHSTSRYFSFDNKDMQQRDFIRTAGRRYSESAGSSFDRRTSLQMPTLTENMEATSSSLKRRIQFNKPLNLGMDDNERSGGGHSRRSSRNLDYDWRSGAGSSMVSPSSPTPFSYRSFNLVPFTPTRVSFARDDANPHQRRLLFIAHLPYTSLTPLFRSRQLVRGLLRVNKRNRNDAYVYCEELEADIYICGSRNRNRALDGDVVAVRLVDVEKILREKKEKEETKLIRNGGQARVRLPDEEDENEIIFGGDDEVDVVQPEYCGVVVAILERAQNQVFSGNLMLMRPNNKRAQEEKAAEEKGLSKKETPRIVWFKSMDKRVPLIAIPIEQAPADFVEKSQEYANRLFVASIKRWPITSLHPFGTLQREIGSVLDVDTQIKAILADNNVTDVDFSDAVKDCLPPIPYDFADCPDGSRRDLRNTRLFTMDPANSKVLDDALSIRVLENDLYEVGVHVSDVAYFIEPHSPLDKEARARSVQVDLLHTSVPMLPPVLTEQVTNLSPGQSRFALSVIWKMDGYGKVLDTWIGKTIVRSSAQLTFDDVEKVLDNAPWDAIQDQKLSSEIAQDIRLLHAIATDMRQTRLQDGAMDQKREIVEFQFDGRMKPLAIHSKGTSSPVQLLKQFLRLANISVAQKISSHFPEQALLRRQAAPLRRKIHELQKYAAQDLGVSLGVSSAGALQQSVESITDPVVRKLVSVLILKTMPSPKYFCTGAVDILKYSHFALNLPLFTHFTAPSRRFVDLIVHRQLEAALNHDKNFYLNSETIQKLAQHSNIKKEASIYAAEQTRTLYLALYLSKNMTHNVVRREATVVAVFDQFFDVMISELNIEKRVHLASLPVWRSNFSSQQRTLTLFWRKGVDTSTGRERRYSMSDEDDEDDEIDEDALLADMENSDEDANTTVHPSDIHSADASAKEGEQCDQENTKEGFTSGPGSSTGSVTSTRRLSKSASRRASIAKACLSECTGYSTEQGYQTIKALDKIQVVVIIEMVKTPPVIRILAANPFA